MAVGAKWYFCAIKGARSAVFKGEAQEARFKDEAQEAPF